MYFNQSEQYSTAVNIDGGLLSKHFWANDKHVRLVTVYTNCFGPMSKMATMPRYTGIRKPLKSSTEPVDLVTRFVALGMRAIPSLHT